MALGRTVSELDHSLSSSELTEWMAYYRLEPFGAWRDNWHMAQLTALLRNVNLGKGKPASKVSDFMWHDEVAKKDSEQASFFAAMRSLAKKG